MARAETAQTTDADGEKVEISGPCTTLLVRCDSGSAVSGLFSIGGIHQGSTDADGTGDFWPLAAGESKEFRSGTDDIESFWVKGDGGTVTYSWTILTNGVR